MHKHTLKVQPIADGCMRDVSRLYVDQDSKLCWFEFTPILNPDKRLPRDEARALAENCTLAGGGWQAVSVQEEVSIRNYEKFGPASDIPGDPNSGAVVTRNDDVEPPLGFVWGVNLGHGVVGILDPYDTAFGRGGRLSPASQEEVVTLMERV